jgi:hypothetical protein
MLGLSRSYDFMVTGIKHFVLIYIIASFSGAFARLS